MKSHFFAGKPHDKLAELEGVSIRVSQTYCLEKNNWLNNNVPEFRHLAVLDDKLVEFYLEYLRQVKYVQYKDMIEVVKPSASQYILKNKHNHFPPLQLSTKRIVLVPLYIGNDDPEKWGHWSLVFLIPSSSSFYHLDTLGTNEDKAKSLVQGLANVLGIEKPRLFSSHAVCQDNPVDCSLYVLKNAEKAIEHFVVSRSRDPFRMARKHEILNMRADMLETIKQLAENIEN